LHCIKALTEASKVSCSTSGHDTGRDEVGLEYIIWWAMMKQSGWEENEHSLPEADHEVMRKYFNLYKEAQKFRHKPLSYRQELEALYTRLAATGANAATIDKVVAQQDADEEDDMQPDEETQDNMEEPQQYELEDM
jgi:hypothetical protein